MTRRAKQTLCDGCSVKQNKVLCFPNPSYSISCHQWCCQVDLLRARWALLKRIHFQKYQISTQIKRKYCISTAEKTELRKGKTCRQRNILLTQHSYLIHNVCLRPFCNCHKYYKAEWLADEWKTNKRHDLRTLVLLVLPWGSADNNTTDGTQIHSLIMASWKLLNKSLTWHFGPSDLHQVWDFS